MADGVSPVDQDCFDLMRKDLENSLPASVAGSKEKELGEKLIPVCCDPREHLAILRNTDEYKGIIAQKLKVSIATFKSVSAHDPLSDDIPPSEEEVIKVYEEGDAFKQLFWNFYEDVLHLSFTPKMYSEKFNEAFEEYRHKAIISVMAAKSGDKDEIIEKDRIRSEAHDKVASILENEKFAPNEFQARMIIRAFLVDLREDYIASARAADHIRMLRVLPTEKARRELMLKIASEEPPRFSTDTKTKVQSAFLSKHPEALFVDPAIYTLPPSENNFSSGSGD